MEKNEHIKHWLQSALRDWDIKFSGCLPLDIENFKSILSKYSSIELHTFNTDDKDNPIIREIKKNLILKS